ncbi:MAG: GNAT family N-acetyltransferase [Candidatus Dormibacteraeota bacterium]|nr:GNAT family N-acetyltransferase [Candidatus Dormibacteraeota bacterium]
MSSAMQVHEVTTADGFDALRDEWNALVPRLDAPSPFQTWEWNRAWWRHFGAGHRLRLLTFRRDGALCGVAQFHERRIGPRVLRRSLLAPLGWEDQRRRQGMTEQSQLVFPAADMDELLAALARWLDTHRWTFVQLAGMAVPFELPQRLSQRVVLTGKPNSFYGRALPATYAELVAGLGKSMRDNVKYYPKLLERTGHSVSLRVANTPETIPPALDVFFALHRARANATAASIAHRDKFAWRDRRAFLADVAPMLAAQGQLRIGLLEVDGATVAVQIWLEYGTAMFVYYTGWDPAWSKYSVQLVATIECIKNGIARGLGRLEFLRGGADGNDQRNERWETQRRVRVNLTLARRPAMTRLVLRIPRVQRRLRLGGASVGDALRTAAPG